MARDGKKRPFTSADAVAVGSAIRAARLSRAWTQWDLARRAGVTQACVSLAERGLPTGATTLERFIDVLRATEADSAKERRR
jgi:predicted transcriptional regulator